MSQRAQFIHRMLVWLNEEVAPKGVHVEAETPLFSTRLLDSLRVLELIAFTEQAIRRLRERGSLWEVAPGVSGLRGPVVSLLREIEAALADLARAETSNEWLAP